jgi:hypothetical protein
MNSSFAAIGAAHADSLMINWASAGTAASSAPAATVAANTIRSDLRITKRLDVEVDLEGARLLKAHQELQVDAGAVGQGRPSVMVPALNDR